MGEKIKILTKCKILGNNFDVELNHPLTKNGDKQVHVQSDKFRYEIDLKDYIKIALGISLAGKQLKRIKKK